MRGSLKFRTLSVAILVAAASALLILALSTTTRSTSAASPQAAAGRNFPTQSYADVVDHVAPAVVTIHAARRVRAPQMQMTSPFDDPLFQQFFGTPNRGRSAPRTVPQQKEMALGSGVIVTADGHIITNHHVMDGAEEISVDLHDRRTLPAKVIGSDSLSDLAVLKIDASNLPVLSLGDSDKVRVGDVCLAVGNPLGIGETVTMGIISAKGRDTREGASDRSFQDFLQTDAAINQGNSGGALVNTQGELIGINSQILSTSGGNIGIGFAIPSNMARNVMEQLTKSGKVSRGRLGVQIQDIDADLAKSLNLKEVRGVLINSVESGLAADKAGMKVGDVVNAINGARVDDMNALRNRVAAIPPGSECTVSVLRDGKEMTLHAKLTELNADTEAAAAPAGGGEGGSGQLGVTVEAVTPEMVTRLKLQRAQGLVVTEVDPNSPAAEKGIQPGDVILEVNRQPVKSAADLKAGVKSSGTAPTLLLVSSDGVTHFVTVKAR